MVNDAELLQTLIAVSVQSDVFEEDAEDFLNDNNIHYHSHSRQYLVTVAFNNGWRPTNASPELSQLH